PAIGALVWGRRRCPLIVAALAPHLIGSLLFFSCWGRPDPRYLVGAAIALLILIVTGTALWSATLAAPERSRGRRLVLCGVTLAAVLVSPLVFPDQAQRRPVELAAGGAAVAGGLASVVAPLAASVPVLAPLAPAAAFAGIGFTRVLLGSGTRDPF